MLLNIETPVPHPVEGAWCFQAGGHDPRWRENVELWTPSSLEKGTNTLLSQGRLRTQGEAHTLETWEKALFEHTILLPHSLPSFTLAFPAVSYANVHKAGLDWDCSLNSALSTTTSQRGPPKSSSKRKYLLWNMAPCHLLIKNHGAVCGRSDSGWVTT